MSSALQGGFPSFRILHNGLRTIEFGSAARVAYTSAEGIIIYKSNPLATFFNMTSCQSGHYFEPLFRLRPHVPRRGCHWHVLSKQRSVPLLRDSFIDIDVYNPTVLRVQLLGNRQILRPGRRRSIFSAFIKGHRPAFPLYDCFFLDSYYLEFQHPGFTLRKLQSCPDPAVKAGGWLLLSWRRISRSFRRQDI